MYACDSLVLLLPLSFAPNSPRALLAFHVIERRWLLFTWKFWSFQHYSCLLSSFLKVGPTSHILEAILLTYLGTNINRSKREPFTCWKSWQHCQLLLKFKIEIIFLLFVSPLARITFLFCDDCMSWQYLEWLYYHPAYMQILAGKTFEKPKGRLIYVLGGFQTSHAAHKACGS